MNKSSAAGASADLPPAGGALSAAELLRERQAHQVALETQNESLRQTLEALEASRDRYAELYEFAPLGYLTLSASGQVAEANFTSARLLGVAREHLLNCRFDHFLSGADRECWREIFSGALTGGDVPTVDVGVTRLDGSTVYLQVDCQFPASRGGAPLLRVALTDVTARHRVESAFRESTRRLARVLEGAEQGFWEWNLQSNTFIASARFESMLGYGPGERDLSIERWGEYVHPEDMPRVNASIERHLRGESPSHEVEMRCLSKSGAWCWVLTRGRIVEWSADGRPLTMSGTHTDISGRKAAEEKLRQSEEYFRQLFEVERDAIFLVDCASLGFLEANAAALDMYGYSRCEFLALNAPDVSAEPEQTVAAVRGGRPGLLTRRHRRKDGTEFSVEIACANFMSGGRQVHVAAVRDVTARLAVEQALRESQERLSLAQRTAQTGVWDWDLLTGKVVWTDEHFRLFGLDPAIHTAGLDTWRQIVHPDDLAMGEANIRAALHERRPLSSESRIVRPSGEVRWLNTVGDTTFDADGRAVRMTGITLDVTERKRVELELARHREHLEEIVAERTAELSAAEAEQRRLNRALVLLGVCNKALVRATSEQQLFDDLCRLAVEAGGYLMAWVGLAEHDAGLTVRPVAQSGYEEGYLDSVRVSWDEARDIGQGPTGTAIRTGKTQVNQNCLTNPVMAPWRDAALRRGYQASLALPLSGEHEVLGTLTLYAAAPDAFGAIEVELLEELAGNMAYGLQALRARGELERSRQELENRVGERTAALADARNRVARFAAAQQRALEQERRRVSREVHDQIGQVFTSIQLILASVAPGMLPPGHSAALAQALAMGVATTRRITAELRPPLLDDLGLVAALEHFTQDLSKRGRLACEVAVHDAEGLGETYTLCLFRVMQEAVTNALRHAGARHLKISGSKHGAGVYVFSIEDDGCGFDPAQVRPGAIGRSAMRERAALLGGNCRIISAPGRGTLVEVRLPLPGTAE